jgi:hypothetical protein
MTESLYTPSARSSVAKRPRSSLVAVAMAGGFEDVDVASVRITLASGTGPPVRACWTNPRTAPEATVSC